MRTASLSRHRVGNTLEPARNRWGEAELPVQTVTSTSHIEQET
jgi:hypothetical protein